MKATNVRVKTSVGKVVSERCENFDRNHLGNFLSHGDGWHTLSTKSMSRPVPRTKRKKFLDLVNACKIADHPPMMQK